jgi:hypothetical protein
VLLRNGRVSTTWDFTLAAGQTWRRSLPLTSAGTAAARLYRLPDLAHPYRYVSVTGISVPGS